MRICAFARVSLYVICRDGCVCVFLKRILQHVLGKLGVLSLWWALACMLLGLLHESQRAEKSLDLAGARNQAWINAVCFCVN